MARARKKSSSRSKSGSKKTPKSRKKRNRGFSMPAMPFERAQLLRFGVVMGWVALLVGMGVGWSIAQPALQAYAGARLSADSVEIRLPPLPSWLDTTDAPDGELPEEALRDLDQVKSRILNEMNFAIASQIEGDVFAQEDLAYARASLLRTGWFKSVERIERTEPGVVAVSGTYFTPFTMIRGRDANHLVTRSGVLLPLRYAQNYRMHRMPLITGTYFDRPDRPGKEWEGTDVDAGLLLAETIVQTSWAHQIAAIDVSEYLHSEAIWLTTVNGARILWGRPPGEERGIEVPARMKVAYLDFFYQEQGRVAGQYRELDLTTDVVLAH